MRDPYRWPVVAAFLVLTGCGHRVSIGSDKPGAASEAAPEIAHLTRICGHALALTVGWSTCNASATLADPSYIFTISKADYAHVAAGASFVLVGDPNAPTSGDRMTGGPVDAPFTFSTGGRWTHTPITAGRITFDTFEADRAATGTYEVVFPGGAASGAFSADFCTPSPVSCRSLPPPPAVPSPATR
jgi:hypothetical protein